MKKDVRTRYLLAISAILMLFAAFFLTLALTGRAVYIPGVNEYLELRIINSPQALNDVFVVQAGIVGGDNIYAYDLEIEYPSLRMQYQQQINDGGYLGSTENEDYLCVDEIASSGSISNIACTNTGTSLSNGDGTLKTLNFRLSSYGQSVISFARSDVAKWPNVNNENTEPTISDLPARSITVYLQEPTEEVSCVEDLNGYTCSLSENCEGVLLPGATDTAICCSVECRVPSQCEDKDGDGYFVYNPITCPIEYPDCNDNNNLVNPGMPEICNTLDDDCDYEINEEQVCSQCNARERLNCSISNLNGPCAEGRKTCSNSRSWGQCTQITFPASTEIPGDNIDNNCNGVIDEEGNCTASWDCEEWSLCEDGEQKRTCLDINSCEQDTHKEEVSECEETCFDNQKNQGETGIDCGGPCSRCEEYRGINLEGFGNSFKGEILSFSPITITIKNSGTQDAKNVVAHITQLNERIIFPEIEAGSEITRTKNIFIPYDFSDSELEVAVFIRNSQKTNFKIKTKINVPIFTVHPEVGDKKINATIFIDNRNKPRLENVKIKALIYDGNDIIMTQESPIYSISNGKIFLKMEEFNFENLKEGKNYNAKFLYMKGEEVLGDYSFEFTAPESQQGVILKSIEENPLIFWTIVIFLIIAVLAIIMRLTK